MESTGTPVTNVRYLHRLDLTRLHSILVMILFALSARQAPLERASRVIKRSYILLSFLYTNKDHNVSIVTILLQVNDHDVTSKEKVTQIT